MHTKEIELSTLAESFEKALSFIFDFTFTFMLAYTTFVKRIEKVNIKTFESKLVVMSRIVKILNLWCDVFGERCKLKMSFKLNQR